MYVYITPDCRQRARERGILEHIETLRQSLESDGALAVQIHFDWNYPYLKHRFQNFRLLGRFQRVGKERVFCFLTVLNRGDPNYEHHFLDNPEEYGKAHFKLDLSHVQSSLQPSQTEPSHPSPTPFPNLLYPWLNKLSWQIDRLQAGVYETKVWVHRFKSIASSPDWKPFHDLIYDIVEAQAKPQSREISSDYDGVNIRQHQGCGYAILFARIQPCDSPEPPALFLIAPFLQLPQRHEIDAIGRELHLFNADTGENRFDDTFSRNQIARYSQRYYPQYFLYDKDDWLAIEREEEGNFALSAEEEEILQNSNLPLFLNGRAGSGKSTMLFYIFADYCERYVDIQAQQIEYFPDTALTQPLPKPLFLTYNKRLLKSARQGVENLFKCHPRFRDKSFHLDISRFFYPFQEFLLSLLPSDDLERFDRDRHLCFHQFEKHYLHAFPRDIPPAECWHVIRAFIKGYRLEDMTADDYDEIPRRERTVERAQFQRVCNVLYPWYKKLLTQHQYWDDQDLIRAVLQQRHLPQKYSAIICDEAQDFTKLELRLIVKLSIFTDYELHTGVYSLPFAFAGDPLQTLNPTGFRWDSVRASFYEQVIACLDPDGTLNIQMDFEELESNYRSSPAIVSVTNLIHLWRHIYFDIAELKPQVAWRPQQGLPPQKFIFHRNLDPARLGEYLQKAPILILPCEEGGELDYVRRDPLLQQVFGHRDRLPENLLSASQAKGLEFPLVILYKFGEALAQKGVSLADLDRHSRTLELEYFFNKLYVAASRPMQELLVLDSQWGDEALWQFADVTGRDRAIAQANRPEDWYERVGTLDWGQNLNVLQRDNREAQAREFRENGLTQENAEFMRRAAEFYRNLGATQQVRECEAYALQFEGQFAEAGAAFLALAWRDEARSCFWQGLCWRDLAQLYAETEEWDDERAIAEFMVSQPPSLSELQQFTQFLEGCEAIANNRTQKPWQVAIRTYCDGVAGWLDRSDDPDAGICQRFGAVLEQLALAKYPRIYLTAGACFYAAQTPKNLRRAVDCWQAGGATTHRDYWLALAQMTGFPEGIEYLQQAEDDAGIVAVWEAAGKPGKANWLKQLPGIHWALQRQNRLGDWLGYLLKLRRWADVMAALAECDEAVRQQWRWQVARRMARSQLTPDTALAQRDRYQGFLQSLATSADWRQHLTPAELGACFERVGAFVPTLAFYEQLTENEQASPRWRGYARERWLATKLKHEAFEAGSNNPGRAREIRRDIERQSRLWGIDVGRVSPEIQLDAMAEPQLRIEGLPPTVTVQWRRETALFAVGGLQVAVRGSATGFWVKLGDRTTGEILKLTATPKLGKVQLGNATMQVQDGSELGFRLGKVCVGRLRYGTATPQVELVLSSGGEGRIVIGRSHHRNGTETLFKNVT